MLLTGKIRLSERTEEVDPQTVLVQGKRFSIRQDTKCVYAGMHGDVLVRLFEDDPGVGVNRRGEDLADTYGFVPNGRVATSRSLCDPLAKLMEENINGPYLALLEVLRRKRAPIEVSMEAMDAKLGVGVPIYIPPLGGRTASAKYKGVLIHLQSLAPNRFEPRVVDEFRRRGWCVVDIATQSTVLPPLAKREETIERLSKLVKEAQEADERELTRLFEGGFEGMNAAAFATMPSGYSKRTSAAHERVARAIGGAQSQRAFRIAPDASNAQVEDVGREIAFQVDNSLAGNAYALESVLDYLETRRPDLAGLPRVIAGFSAGALVTPSGVARVRERFPIAACVLIGGGVDMFYMSQESTLTDGGLTVRCVRDDNDITGSRPDRKLLERVHNSYLRQSKLDPIYTASALRGVPVLQLHAAWDEWVPHKAGEALWEQLGRPERWELDSLPPLGGHLALFWLLPGKRAEIADWVERAVFGEKAVRR